MPHDRPRAGGDRLRARRPADRQAQHRRQPADRGPVPGARDPDHDPLPQRPGGQADPGRAPEEAHRGRVGARAGVVPSGGPLSDRWRIHLCGELRVELAGERREAQLRGRQGRLAFAYLVLHRDRPVRRHELIDALWANEAGAPSDTALNPVLSRLRRAIEPAVLEGRDTLRIVFPEAPWVDVEMIRDLVATGDREAARAAAELAGADLLP